MSNYKPMPFMSSAVFWGIVIILVGLSIILREIFHVHIPFFRIIFGILLMYWGFKMLVGGFYKNWGSNATVFNESKMNYDGSQHEYNVIFGKGTVDLFKTEMPTQDKKVEVNAVFGHVILILNDSIPTRVEMNPVFGSVRAPEKNSNGIGSSIYTNAAYKEGQPCLLLEANAVFGSIDIRSNRW